MENIQTLLTVVVIALTVLLIIIGSQIFLMILDLRKALRRLNNLLDDSILGGGLLRPDRLTGIAELFKKKMKSHGQGEQPLS